MKLSSRPLIGMSVVLCFAFTSVKAGQARPGEPQGAYHGSISLGGAQIDSLESLYRDGEWAKLQVRARGILGALKFDSNIDKPMVQVDLKSDYYIVMFVSKNLKGENEILRFIVHDPDPVEFMFRLPGLDDDSKAKVYEVMLTNDPQAQLQSRYSFVQNSDPLLSDLPGAIGKLAESVAKAVQHVWSFQVTPTGANDLHAVMLRMEIPFTRALIAIDNVIKLNKKGTSEIVTGAYTIENVPPRTMSLGLVTAGMFKVVNNRRAKVANNLISPDPLSDVAAMVAVNFYPWARDDLRGPSSLKERLHVFVGGMIKPEFGIALGLGIELFKNVAIDAGWAGMIIDRVKSSETVGAAPLDANPLKADLGVGYFLGLGLPLK